jgi:hypothetical protein
MITISTDFYVYEWNRSYTINVWGGRGEEMDCFSLDYGNPAPTLVDFAQAVMQYEEGLRDEK